MSKREYGVDLLRIIATLQVIVLHVLGQGGVLSNAAPGGASYWNAWFIEIMAFCAVNCFALITGYVMADNQIKAGKIIRLWFDAAFYSLLLTFLLFVFVPEERSVYMLATSFFPVCSRQWWYVSSYFALFFCIPILNAAINHISKATYEKFLAAVLIGAGIIERIIPGDAFSFVEGYSCVWLIVMYLFGAYIKKYDLKQKITAMKAILGFLTINILTFLSEIVLYYTTNAVFGESRYGRMFVSYTSATIVLAAVFLFLFCLNCRIGAFGRKIIGLLAPASFGVYLIHVHYSVFEYIIKDRCVSFANKPLLPMLACVLAATFAVYVPCVIIEWGRIQLFKRMSVNRLCEIAGDRVSRLCLKLWKE